MEFEWDPGKAASNLLRHEADFAYAARVFLDPGRSEVVDSRRDYGEERRVTLGVIDGRVHVVAFTMRGGRIRLISARRANAREQAIHASFQA